MFWATAAKKNCSRTSFNLRRRKRRNPVTKPPIPPTPPANAPDPRGELLMWLRQQSYTLTAGLAGGTIALLDRRIVSHLRGLPQPSRRGLSFA
jgi:hypothetical protein